MRLPLIALFVAASVAPAAAQTGTLAQPAAPAARPEPRPRYPVRDRYYDDRYVLVPPAITMDSATRVVEAKYEGWYVDSKQLVYERYDPVYFINLISAGATGSRLVVVDGDTGEVLNPEVMGAPSDSTSYWHGHRRRHYRSTTYP
jgi:hypothetical protein